MKFTLSIKKNKVFKYILKKGNYARGNYIAIHVSSKNIREFKRIEGKNYLGVCVSKKNGNSVKRNKLKRWAREVYKNEEENLKKGYNIVILYKKSITFDMLDFKKVKSDILKCLKELNIYEKY